MYKCEKIKVKRMDSTANIQVFITTLFVCKPNQDTHSYTTGNDHLALCCTRAPVCRDMLYECAIQKALLTFISISFIVILTYSILRQYKPTEFNLLSPLIAS